VRRATIVVFGTCLACASAATARAQTADRSQTHPPVPSVAGSYRTQVTVREDGNTCGPVSVQNNITSVVQTPGAPALSLTHAGHTYQGTLDSLGRFSTTASTLTIGGAQYTIAISGLFSRTGFDATTRVGVHQATRPATCAYAVHWVGTKDGAPNSFP
jgi:hypothetical protein